MAQISTHLNRKPFQIATTRDPALPHRKWNHRQGFVPAVTHKDAAYKARNGKPGDIIGYSSIAKSTVYEFADGEYISVGFGS